MGRDANMREYIRKYGCKDVCVYCGTDINLTLDHIVPISAGGSRKNCNNWAPACNKCNNDKGNGSILQTLMLSSVRNRVRCQMNVAKKKKPF